MMRAYKDIQYTLKRSRRKTASIYIERDGQVTVLVPQDLSDAQVEELLEQKRKWIYRHLAEWHDLNATRVQRQYVNGEGFLYLGRSYRLKLVKDQAVALALKDGYFCLLSPGGLPADAEAAFKAFYREKGAVRIPERVAYYQRKTAVEAKVGQDSGPEAPLGILLTGRQAELPLEVHDGSRDRAGLHRRPRVGAPSLPQPHGGVLE